MERQRQRRTALAVLLVALAATHLDGLPLVDSGHTILDGGGEGEALVQLEPGNASPAPPTSFVNMARDAVSRARAKKATAAASPAAASPAQASFVKMAKVAVKQARAKKAHAAKSEAKKAREGELKAMRKTKDHSIAQQALKFKVAQAAAKATKEATEKATAEVLEQKAQASQDRIDSKGDHTRLGDAPQEAAGEHAAKRKAEKRLAKAEKAYSDISAQQGAAVQQSSSTTSKADEPAVTAKAKRGSEKTEHAAATAPSHKHIRDEHAPSARTEKQWQQLAVEADDIAKEKIFYSKLLSKVSKSESAYSGLLQKERTSDRTAKRVESEVGGLMHNFYSPKVGQHKTSESELELGEDSSTTSETKTSEGATTQNVKKLEAELAESKESAAAAAQAEAAAEKVVAKQRAELSKAEANERKPAAPSADTKQLESQQKDYSKAAVALKSQPGEVAAVAAKAAAAAEKVAQNQVKIAEKRDKTKAQDKQFETENEDGQVVRAAEKQEHQAISKAQDAASRVKNTEVKLSDAEKNVASLKAKKKAEAADAVPLAWAALKKESATHQKLSTELQALSDKAQTEQASQTRLDTKSHRIRDMAINVKNMAEQQFDRLGEKVGRLGESASSASGSKWEAGIKQDLSTLQKQRGQVKTLVKAARRISLDAAKVQEKEYQAADASSRLEVDAHVLSRQLSVDKGDLSALKKTNASAKALQDKLKKMANQDHKVYLDISQLSGEATNAESAEEAGIKETGTEVRLGDKLLHNIADDLLPGH